MGIFWWQLLRELYVLQGAMMSIAFKEGLKIPPPAMHEIILAANQDIRQVSASSALVLVQKVWSPWLQCGIWMVLLFSGIGILFFFFCSSLSLSFKCFYATKLSLLFSRFYIILICGVQKINHWLMMKPKQMPAELRRISNWWV